MPGEETNASECREKMKSKDKGEHSIAFGLEQVAAIVVGWAVAVNINVSVAGNDKAEGNVTVSSGAIRDIETLRSSSHWEAGQLRRAKCFIRANGSSRRLR